MTTTHPSANDSGLNLDHLEALRRLTKERDGWRDEAAHQKALYERACESVEMLRDHERAHFWIWQGDGTDNLKSMTDGMTVLTRADHLRAALANQPAPTVPAGDAIKSWKDRLFEHQPDARKYPTGVVHDLGAAYKDAEIADLRAALAHQPAQEQAEPVRTLPESLPEEVAQYLQSRLHSPICKAEAVWKKLRAMLIAAQQEPVAAPQQAAAPSVESVEPPRMTTDESREYLIKFMEKHFTDKTYHRYIRGERGSVNLAGDFAWQMARALRMLAAAPGNSPEIPDGSLIDEGTSAPGTPEVPVECLTCDAEYCARCPVAKQRGAQLDGGQEGSGE
jgi:hypothetical protein